MKRRMRILTLIVLGLLCTMVIAIQTAKASVLYDLNGDGIVNIEDIGRVCAAFRSYLGDLRFDEMSDFDVNGIINIRDIGLIAIQFGEIHTHTPHKPPGLTFVVPELPLGSILGLVGCFTALGIFSLTKPSKHNWHFSKR